VRYALISDIHGNLPALEAVLADIERRPRIDAVHHLGDLVGYGPWPNEVVSLLQKHRVVGIVGNKDSKLVAATRRTAGGSAHAEASRDWTHEHTTAESARCLARLPFRVDLRPRGGHIPGPTVTLVHGTPVQNTHYWHEEAPDSFCLEMAQLIGARSGDVLCFGHTHKPWHREVDGIHFINTGSVGRPKDGDWRAGYVVLDMSGDAPAVEFVRVEYDLEKAMVAIRGSDLPDDFAEFLATGGMPSASGRGAG
jgi:predicted phosphodiesterase